MNGPGYKTPPTPPVDLRPLDREPEYPWTPDDEAWYQQQDNEERQRQEDDGN